jgi:hypothetical protein
MVLLHDVLTEQVEEGTALAEKDGGGGGIA